MHEISEELFKEKGNIQMKVYSDYPFPSRASREQDSFAKEALSAISANKGIYFRQDKINNIDVMRVAIPDYFSSPACIACHNSLQSSPKKNWKLNDISGVIEINVPIEKQLSIMRTETLNVLFILSIIFIFIGYMIFYRLKQKVITPIKVIESSLVSIDEGKPLCSVNLKEVTEFSNLSNRINNVSKNLFDKIAAAKSESSLRKIAQDELRHVNANLEDQVRIRTIEVQEKNEQLHEKIAVIEATRERLIETEKMASLGSMVAGVAHEINTPIGTALTAQTFLLDKSEAIQHKMKNNNLAKKEFDDFLLEMDASLSLINSNLSRAADLISSFKQISADQSVELRGKFKVEELLSNCKTTASPNLHEGQHTIVIECDSDIVISSYPGVLTQIIINLISNSQLHGFEDKQKGIITITVTKEQVDKVFEPFYTTKRTSGGTGLGMSISYNLITQKLKGSINCISKLGEYTEFTLKLPHTVKGIV